MGLLTRNGERFRRLVALLVLLAPLTAGAETPASGKPDDGQAPTSPERAMITTDMDSEAAARASPEQAVWLDAGDSGRVLGLMAPEQNTPAKGAVILLNDEGLPADAGVIGALREPLAKAGWAALSLGLPLPTYALQKVRQMEAEPLPSTPSGAPPDASPDTGGTAPKAGDSVMIDVMQKDIKGLEAAYRKLLHEHLQAAVAELGRRGYSPVILVGLGRAAEVITQEVAANGTPVAGLVWVAPVFAPEQRKRLPDLMKAVKQPVLELYSHRRQAKAADQRQAMMARAGVGEYRQQPVNMDLPPEARDARQLAGRITGWLAR